MFRFVCFYCQKVLKTEEDKVGRLISCPRCKKQLTVPAPPGGQPKPSKPTSAVPGVPMARKAPPRKPLMKRIAARMVKPVAALVALFLIGFSAMQYVKYSNRPHDEQTKAEGTPDEIKDAKTETPAEPPPPPKKKEVPDYIADLGDKDLNVRLEAAAFLEKDGLGGKEAVKPFTAALQEKAKSDDAVLLRRFAASALGKLGPKLDAKAQEALAKDLREGARDDSQEVRFLALEALGKLGKPALPFLRECLTDNNNPTKIKAAAVLAGMGEDAKPLAPDIFRAVERADATTKILLAAHLVKLDPANELLIPILLNGLRTSDNKVKITSAVALGHMGKVASSTANALYDVAIKDKSDEVKSAAADALEKVRDDK